jgi:hypothetical protein
MPETVYSYLYIRKPAADSPEAGDVDFVLSTENYKQLKAKLQSGFKIKNAAIYDKPGWDNIEIRDPQINALAYVGTQEMAEKARIKF